MSMKHFIGIILAVALTLCLCACGTDQQPAVTTEPTTEAAVPTTKTTEPTTDAAEPSYQVTVVDEGNNPVVGAWVQLCLESCVPATTDENGVAKFFLEENNYKVGFTVMPAGYEYAGEEQEWYFADGENTMTITLKKAA